MTSPSDDAIHRETDEAIQDLVLRAHEADPDRIEFDVEAGLREILARAARQKQNQRSVDRAGMLVHSNTGSGKTATIAKVVSAVLAGNAARWSRGLALYESVRNSASAYRPHQAVVQLRRALRLLGDDDDPQHVELRVRIQISLAYQDAEMNGLASGIAHLHAAEETLLDVPDEIARFDLETTIRSQLAVMLMRAGRVAESIHELDHAIELGEKANAYGALNHAPLSNSLLNRALAHAAVGELRQARRDLRRCVEIAESGRQHDVLGADRLAVLAANAHHNLGSVAWRVGDIPGALRHFEDAQREFVQFAPGFLPKLRMDQAESLLAAGLADQAAQYLDEALTELRRQRDQRYLAEAEALRAAAALVQGDLRLARRLAATAGRRFLQRGNPAWAAITALTSLRADVADALPRARIPDKLPSQAFLLADELAGLRLADESALARMLGVRLTLRRGKVDAAARQLALVPRKRTVMPMDHRMLLRLCRAELALATGNRRSAFRQIGAGLAELARNSERLGGLELVCGTAVHGHELGELAIRLNLDQPRPNARQLFNWLERGRTQVYGYEPQPPTDDPALAEQVDQYRQFSRDLQQAQLRGEPVRGLTARRAAAQREVMRLGWRDGPWGRPRPVAGIKDVLSQLGNRALISYVTHGATIAAVVLADGRANLIQLGSANEATIAAAELHADIDALAPDHLPQQLVDVVTRSARARAHRLDRQLLQPLQRIIGNRELIIIPTANLYAIAWGALPSLLGRPVVVAPSATSWLLAAHGPTAAKASPTVLATGPGLPHATGELSTLGELYPTSMIMAGEHATVANILHSLEGAQMAHVAAHGAHEPQNAQFSRLELADGALFAHQIRQLRQPPEHVVLAACELALTSMRPGDAATGFAQALLAAGVKTVTVAVTRVGDNAAATALADYHRRLTDGTPPAIAMAETTAADPFRRPFVVIGASG